MITCLLASQLLKFSNDSSKLSHTIDLLAAFRAGSLVHEENVK